MKKNLLSVALVAVAALLSSCENLETTESKRLEAWQSQVSHYMGKSVYQVGDKVVMITEKGVEEEFEVTRVDEGDLFIAKKLRLGESEKKHKNNPLVMVDVMLQLESEENEVQIWTIQHAETYREPSILYGVIARNEEIKEVIPEDMYVVNNFDVTQPTITVTGKNDVKAVFVRDEGLRQLTDTLGHTWTRK